MTTAARIVKTPFTAAWLTPDRIALIVLMGVGAGLATGMLVSLSEVFSGLPDADAATRLTETLVVACLPAVIVLLHVSACFRLFDTEAALDPLALGESRRFQISARALQNTVEQAVIFLPALLALGGISEGEDWRLVPALAVTWSVGRVLFTLGYLVNGKWRAVGMVMTLVASVVALVAVGERLL